MITNITENFFIKNVNSGCVNTRIHRCLVSTMTWRTTVYFPRVFLSESNKILDVHANVFLWCNVTKPTATVYASITLVLPCLKIPRENQWNCNKLDIPVSLLKELIINLLLLMNLSSLKYILSELFTFIKKIKNLFSQENIFQIWYVNFPVAIIDKEISIKF